MLRLLRRVPTFSAGKGVPLLTECYCSCLLCPSFFVLRFFFAIFAARIITNEELRYGNDCKKKTDIVPPQDRPRREAEAESRTRELHAEQLCVERPARRRL